MEIPVSEVAPDLWDKLMVTKAGAETGRYPTGRRLNATANTEWYAQGSSRLSLRLREQRPVLRVARLLRPTLLYGFMDGYNVS